MSMVEILGVLGGFNVLSLLLARWWASWLIHLEIMNDRCIILNYPCRYGSYKQFIENMNNHKWKRDVQFPTSFFSPITEHYYHNYVHASLFIFDEVGMKFGCIEYLKVLLWLNKNKYIEQKD